MLDRLFKKYRNVMFDLDGTLVDTMCIWERALENVLAEQGYTEYLLQAKEHLRMGVSPFFFTDRNEARRLFILMRTEFLSIMKEEGIRTIIDVKYLETLSKEKHLSLVTSAKRDVALKVLDMSGLKELFDVVITSSDTVRLKPHPEPIWKVLEVVEGWPAIFIGDTYVDMLAARRATVEFMHIKGVVKYVKGGSI